VPSAIVVNCECWGAIHEQPWLPSAWAFVSAIPVLAAAHDGYEVSTQASKQHHTIDLVTIFMPRLVLGLILAFVVYGFFRAIGSILMRLHGVALAAQPTWQFITSKQSARRLNW